jgi:hypothetical protein
MRAGDGLGLTELVDGTEKDIPEISTCCEFEPLEFWSGGEMKIQHAHTPPLQVQNHKS